MGLPAILIRPDMDILYHYCSTASFHAIAQSHSLWLSALSLSNDTMEGTLVASTIARLADRDRLDGNHVQLLLEDIRFLEETFAETKPSLKVW